MTKHLTTFVFLFSILVASASAQQSAPPTIDSEEGKRRVCQLRGWLLPGSKGDFTLRLASAVEPQGGKVLSTSSSGASTADPSYTENPAGSFLAEVTDANLVVLASQQVRFVRDGFYTLLASQDKDGKWSVTSFSDNLTSPDASEKPVRLLNFADGLETLVELPDAKPLKIAGNSWVESNYPAEIIEMTVKVLAADGDSPAQSSTEIDLGVWPTAYVLIAPDHRGRMRPRLIDGGEPKLIEADTLPASEQQ